MTPPSFVRIWLNSGRRGRCRFCDKRIVWGISDTGKRTPLDATAKPIRTETETKNGATFEVFAIGDCHFRTCRKQPPKRRASSSPSGQPRFF